jgi:hypothetical protein
MVVWPKFTLTAEGITPVTVAANVFAMLSITFGSLYQKRFMGSVDLRTGNALQFIGAAAVLLLAALATESFDITWNGPVIFGMTWLVFVLVNRCHQPAVPDDPAWRDIAHHNLVLPGARRHGLDRLADVWRSTGAGADCRHGRVCRRCHAGNPQGLMPTCDFLNIAAQQARPVVFRQDMGHELRKYR